MHQALAFGVVIGLCVSTASAQQINTGVNNVGASDGFSEFTGTSWGVQGRGWFFNFGGGLPGGAAPPFGPVGGGASGGFGFGGGGVSGGFRFLAQQGSTRSIGGTSGSITGLNGAPGFIFDGRLVPFVTEIIPVVGGGVGGVGGLGGMGGGGGFGAAAGPRGPGPLLPMSPLRHRLSMIGGPEGLRRAALRDAGPVVDDEGPAAEDRLVLARRGVEDRPAAGGGGRDDGSSADRGAASVDEIRRQQASDDAAKEAELAPFVAEAERLEATGDARAAANAYGRAAAKAEGERREELLQKARQLRRKQ